MSEGQLCIDEYVTLVASVVDSAIAWQAAHNHPRIPTFTLIEQAEQAVTKTFYAELAIRFGPVHLAAEGLQNPEVVGGLVRDLGSRGIITYLASRAILSDGRKLAKWDDYLTENARRWDLPRPE